MSVEMPVSIFEFASRFRLDAIPSDQHAAHLPPAVAAALLETNSEAKPEANVIVFACPDEYSDTAAFSARFGFGLEDCANTLILKYSKEQGELYAAVVTLGSRRLDVNGAVKERLGAKRLSFARREVATEVAAMEFGGITALGLPAGMRILIDAAVMERPYVVMGAGRRQTKLLLAPSTLLRLSMAEVAPLAF